MTDMTDQPMTWAEQLDAAQNGAEFAQVINNLFTWLERHADD